MTQICSHCGKIHDLPVGAQCASAPLHIENEEAFKAACRFQGVDPQTTLNNMIKRYVKAVTFITAGKAERSWDRFLDSGYCKRDSVTGNRPCDDGKICDDCKTKEARQKYASYFQQQR